MVCFIGYDPVEKLHKVLGMVWVRNDRTKDHQVLTLGGGTEEAAWRMTEYGIRCSSSRNRQNVCIDGVFYYIESVADGSDDLMIIRFDVRSEKYSFVKFPERVWYPELIDCNGKLAFVSVSLCGTTKDIEMWVLQDPERHEWSNRVYVLPPMWEDVVGPHERLHIVGVTGRNEFVMSPTYSSGHFHVYYCNFEKETVTRAVIQGMGAFGSGRSYDVRTCLNHVEDVKLMKL